MNSYTLTSKTGAKVNLTRMKAPKEGVKYWRDCIRCAKAKPVCASWEFKYLNTLNESINEINYPMCTGCVEKHLGDMFLNIPDELKAEFLEAYLLET